MLKNKILSLFEIDIRSLVAFRVAAGLLAVYDALIKFPHIRWMYSKESYRDFSSQVFDRGIAIHELIANLELVHWQGLILLQVVAGVLLIIGWRPRIWLAVWLVVLRLTMRRNDLAAHIGDLVFTFFAYAILFLPLTPPKKSDTTIVSGKVGAPWTLPFYVQLFCLYFYAGFTKLENETWQSGIFFVRNVQSHGVWERLSFLAEYPEFLSRLSIALPIAQIVMSVSLLIPWKKHWVRAFYILFWVLFHIVGHIMVPEATMPFFVTVPLILLVPGEFWNWLSPKWMIQIISATTHLEKWTLLKKSKAALAIALCFVFISSNHFSIYHRNEAWAQSYFTALGRIFLYQYWSVFAGFAKRHHTYTFLLKERPESTELIELSDIDRPNDLIEGRFAVMKRALHGGDGPRERWAAALCLDKREQRNDPQLYGIVIRRYTWEFSDQPPLRPDIQQTDEKQFECETLIKKHMGRYN